LEIPEYLQHFNFLFYSEVKNKPIFCFPLYLKERKKGKAKLSHYRPGDALGIPES
jgi:hypothetical protein